VLCDSRHLRNPPLLDKVGGELQLGVGFGFAEYATV
jgi:hypothetical protein